MLLLLDCASGAASASFASGEAMFETIAASSWDAIAPDPGRYSFTSALLEVLSGWKNKVFSAPMLHAECLARLKHPRPVMLNGKNFETRSTPVYFMMTSDYRKPSIEIRGAISHGSKHILPAKNSGLLEQTDDNDYVPINSLGCSGSNRGEDDDESANYAFV